MPYVTFAPGPTVNVLGSYRSKPIIEVTGHPSYRDKGGLRLLTVIPSGPEDRSAWRQMVLAWADPDKAVYPYKAIYGRRTPRRPSTSSRRSRWTPRRATRSPRPWGR